MERTIVSVHSGPIKIFLAHAPAVKSISTVNILGNTLQLSDPSATLVRVAKSRHSVEIGNDCTYARLASRYKLFVNTTQRVKKPFNAAGIGNGIYRPLRIGSHINCELFDEIKEPSRAYARGPWNQPTGNGRSFQTE